MSLKSLSQVVCVAGVYNLLLAVGICVPFVTNLLALPVADAALAQMIGAMLVFTAAAQVIGSRDLKTYAWLIFWEGLLRWMAAGLLIAYGFFGHLGLMAGLMGVVDFLIGVVFVVLLPRAVQKSRLALLTGAS